MRTLSGDPVEELALAVAAEDVVALVLGARGAVRGPGRPATSSLPSPVGPTSRWSWCRPAPIRPTRLHTVLVAMEGSPGKARALRRTIELSADAGLEIVVVHVDEEIPSFTDQVQHETEAYAKEFFARHILYAPQVRLELRIGDSRSAGDQRHRHIPPGPRCGRMAPHRWTSPRRSGTGDSGLESGTRASRRGDLTSYCRPERRAMVHGNAMGSDDPMRVH